MTTCPTCGLESPAGVHFCPKDGTALASGVIPPGSLIGSMVDRYRIIGRLGEGGMGTVYRAEHTHLGRQVALKLLHPELARSPAVLDRFFREARAASEVQNPHIIEVIDFGTTSDARSFLVMELLDGISLRELLDKVPNRRLPIRRAVSLAVQISDALASAHEKGVVHRDLKPANVVLVQRDGNPDFVKILDFGIAKLNEPGGAQLTQTGMIMGSPTYMSPEQAAGKSVDGRADLYSLGVILYEMMTGGPPFAGDGPTSVLMAQMSEMPDPPRTRNPDVPEELEALVLRCLQKRPEERPADLAMVSAALEAWQQGQSDELMTSLPHDASDQTMPAGPAALAALRQSASAALVPEPSTSIPVTSAEATGLVMPLPRPRPHRRTGIALAAAIVGLLAGVGLTLHLLGISPKALISPLAERLLGADSGARPDGSASTKAIPPRVARPDASRPDHPATVHTPSPDVQPTPDSRSSLDAGLDDDIFDDEEEQPSSSDADVEPARKQGKAVKRNVVVPAEKRVKRPRLTPRQAARRQALKARLKAEHVHLKKLLRAHRISYAQYRRAVARLKARYRRGR